MVLYGEDRPVLEPDPFVRAVEQRDVGDFGFGGQAVGHHHEAVVLAGDLDPPGLQVLDRVVRAPVAALHLFRPGAERQAQQLVAEADRSEEHTSELQSLMRISYAVFCLKKKKKNNTQSTNTNNTN